MSFYRCEFVKRLGEGGLGYVDKVVVRESDFLTPGTFVAAKYLKKKNDSGFVDRFRREVEATGGMGHPNIITVLGYNLSGDRPHYLMPLYQTTVRSTMSGQIGNWKYIAGIGAILADALSYAHALGHYHRDLKPDNLLFDDKGPIQIADWGIGKFIHRYSAVLGTHAGIGTPYYCAPEQWLHAQYGPTVDVFSLGRLLDEWVRGGKRGIFTPKNAGAISNPRTAGARHFNSVLYTMTLAAPSQRLRTMDDVAQHLRHALALDSPQPALPNLSALW